MKKTKNIFNLEITKEKDNKIILSYKDEGVDLNIVLDLHKYKNNSNEIRKAVYLYDYTAYGDIALKQYNGVYFYHDLFQEDIEKLLKHFLDYDYYEKVNKFCFYIETSVFDFMKDLKEIIDYYKDNYIVLDAIKWDEENNLIEEV